MPASRPNSRPVSRSNSISEAPINLPVDHRIAHLNADQHTHHRHHEHHNQQDPKLFGPGFSTAAPHSAVEGQVKYVLVTPEMLQAIESGKLQKRSLTTCLQCLQFVHRLRSPHKPRSPCRDRSASTNSLARFQTSSSRQPSSNPHQGGYTQPGRLNDLNRREGRGAPQ